MATNVKTAAVRIAESNAVPASRASWCEQLQIGDFTSSALRITMCGTWSGQGEKQ